jgi:hypothetical protein
MVINNNKNKFDCMSLSSPVYISLYSFSIRRYEEFHWQKTPDSGLFMSQNAECFSMNLLAQYLFRMNIIIIFIIFLQKQLFKGTDILRYSPNYYNFEIFHRQF